MFGSSLGGTRDWLGGSALLLLPRGLLARSLVSGLTASLYMPIRMLWMIWKMAVEKRDTAHTRDVQKPGAAAAAGASAAAATPCGL